MWLANANSTFSPKWQKLLEQTGSEQKDGRKRSGSLSKNSTPPHTNPPLGRSEPWTGLNDDDDNNDEYIIRIMFLCSPQSFHPQWSRQSNQLILILIKFKCVFLCKPRVLNQVSTENSRRLYCGIQSAGCISSSTCLAMFRSYI